MVAPLSLSARPRTTPLLQLGGTFSYGSRDGSLTLLNAYQDFSSFDLGAELRYNPSQWFSLSIPLSFYMGDDSFSISLFPAANLNIPFSHKVDFAIGAGPAVDLTFSGGSLFVNGNTADNFQSTLSGLRLMYRTALTFNVEWYMSWGLFITVPMKGTFDSGLFAPDFTRTRIGFAVLGNLF